MWDYLLMDRPYDTDQPVHTIGWALLTIMTEGKPDLPKMEWVSWEAALRESGPELCADIYG